MHQTLIQGCRLTGKPSVSKIEILGSNPSVPANLINIANQNLWKGSLTGKAVVPKTTAHLSLAGSSPVPSANRWRRRLMVWQRFAKSPRIACAGSTPVASANSSDLSLRGMRARLCEGRGRTFKSCQVHQSRNSYGVAELERRESLKLVYVGSNPTSVASLKSLTRSTLES